MPNLYRQSPPSRHTIPVEPLQSQAEELDLNLQPNQPEFWEGNNYHKQLKQVYPDQIFLQLQPRKSKAKPFSQKDKLVDLLTQDIEGKEEEVSAGPSPLAERSDDDNDNDNNNNSSKELTLADFGCLTRSQAAAKKKEAKRRQLARNQHLRRRKLQANQ